MSDWTVGEQIESSAEWVNSDGEVTTGTASVKYWLISGSDRLYLQSNLTTFTSSVESHTLSYNSEQKWFRYLTVPAAANGFVITEEMRHSDSNLPPIIFEHRVTTYDIDDAVEDDSDGAHVGG